MANTTSASGSAAVNLNVKPTAEDPQPFGLPTPNSLPHSRSYLAAGGPQLSLPASASRPVVDLDALDSSDEESLPERLEEVETFQLDDIEMPPTSQFRMMSGDPIAPASASTAVITGMPLASLSSNNRRPYRARYSDSPPRPAPEPARSQWEADPLGDSRDTRPSYKRSFEEVSPPPIASSRDASLQPGLDVDLDGPNTGDEPATASDSSSSGAPPTAAVEHDESPSRFLHHSYESQRATVGLRRRSTVASEAPQPQPTRERSKRRREDSASSSVALALSSPSGSSTFATAPSLPSQRPRLSLPLTINAPFTRRSPSTSFSAASESTATAPGAPLLQPMILPTATTSALPTPAPPMRPRSARARADPMREREVAQRQWHEGLEVVEAERLDRRLEEARTLWGAVEDSAASSSSSGVSGAGFGGIAPRRMRGPTERANALWRAGEGVGTGIGGQPEARRTPISAGGMMFPLPGEARGPSPRVEAGRTSAFSIRPPNTRAFDYYTTANTPARRSSLADALAHLDPANANGRPTSPWDGSEVGGFDNPLRRRTPVAASPPLPPVAVSPPSSLARDQDPDTGTSAPQRLSREERLATLRRDRNVIRERLVMQNLMIPSPPSAATPPAPSTANTAVQTDNDRVSRSTPASPNTGRARRNLGDFLRNLSGGGHRFGALFDEDFGAFFGRDSAALDPRNYLDDDDFDASYEALLRLSERLGDVKPRGVPEDKIKALKTFVYREWPLPPRREGDLQLVEASSVASTSAVTMDVEHHVYARRGLEKEERCAVCLMDYDEDDECMLGDCGHGFHAECLSAWLKDHSACPVCRRVVE